jgi:Na+/phosphate symporter
MSKNRFGPKQEITQQPDVVEQIINQQKRKEKMQESEGDIHRVNFNMPKYLYELSREKTTKKGMTLTNYILGLIRKDLGEE